MATDFNHKFPEGGKSSGRVGKNSSPDMPKSGRPASNQPGSEFPKRGESNNRSPTPPHKGDNPGTDSSYK